MIKDLLIAIGGSGLAVAITLIVMWGGLYYLIKGDTNLWN